jgi:hypothetical protein
MALFVHPAVVVEKKATDVVMFSLFRFCKIQWGVWLVGATKT